MSDATIPFDDDPLRSTATLRLTALHHDTAVMEGVGMVYAFRAAEVDRLLHDRRLQGVGLSLFDVMGIPDGPLRRWYGSLMFTNEGEDHHRLRRLVAKAFTPASVERLRASVASMAEQRLEPLDETGEGDLVALLGDLPTATMSLLLGIDEGDVQRYVGWLDALSPVFGFLDADQVAAADAAIRPMLATVGELVEARAAHPSDDLISALVRAEDDGDRLTRSETVDMVTNLLVGGHDTTASQIGCSLFTLLTHEGALEWVDTHPEHLASVASETIRFEPSLPGAPRTVLEPTDIGGVERQPGTLALLCTLTANRDPAVWADPDRLVLDRFSHAGAPKLLSFGAGAHYCLGAALARLTLEESIRAVALRRPVLAVDPAGVGWVTVLGRSPTTLPVRR